MSDEIRSAVAHAVAAELDRLPPRTRAVMGLSDTDAVVESVLSGGDSVKDLAILMAVGSPDFDIADAERLGIEPEVAQRLQDRMLREYTSEGWTPEQIEALGRDPESLEYSPGAKMLADTRARQELIGKAAPRYKPAEATTGGWLMNLLGDSAMGPVGETENVYDQDAQRFEAARQYMDAVKATHAPFSLQSLQSPETTLGNYATKMGPVMADAASQLGTALLSDGESAMDSIGNAAVRSYGADWNRVSPVLKNHTDWRSSHKLINDMRNAYADSTGMDSADTLRAATGIKPSGWTRPVEWAMSVGNGMLDGSVGASLGKPGVWKAIGEELIEETLTDGGINAAVELFTPRDFRQQKEQESGTAFAQRQQEESARRQQSIKQLEANNDQIKRPETWFQKYAAKPFGNVIGGLLD